MKFAAIKLPLYKLPVFICYSSDAKLVVFVTTSDNPEISGASQHILEKEQNVESF